jgi:hypothetical protein
LLLVSTVVQLVPLSEPLMVQFFGAEGGLAKAVAVVGKIS